MELLGKYFGIDVFYLNKQSGYLDHLPEQNWYCLLIANEEYNKEELLIFAKKAINLHVLGIYSQGKLGNNLDADLSTIRTDLEINDYHPEIDTYIYGESDTDLASFFWDCFGSSALPERTDYNSLKLICMAFDGKNYKSELKNLLKKFNDGWLPGE